MAGLLGLLRQQRAGGAPPPEDEPRPAGFAARSEAVRALEHAVAAGSAGEPAHKKVAQGRAVPPGAEYVYDVDAHAPHEAQVALEVSPITMLHSEYEHKHHRQIAVDEQFICYGLKQGHIRVLCRASADRQLCKGHASPITDMRFAPGGGSLLASGSSGGQLIVWRLAHVGSEVSATQVLNAEFSNETAGTLPDMCLAWGCGTSQVVLAVGVGQHVVLAAVQPDTSDKLVVNLHAPTGVLALPRGSSKADITSLCFSPDGTLLAAGDTAGLVTVWQLELAPGTAPVPLRAAGAALALGASATAPGAVGALQWLPPGSEGGGWVLVRGNSNNSVLELWHSAHSSPPEFSLLQRVKFECASGPQEFFNHVEPASQAQLLVVADTPKKAIYTLHYSGAGAACRIDYIARFGVAVPVLNFTTSWGGGEEDGADSDDEPTVQLFCVQTTAVQMYKLDPELCRTEAGAAEVSVSSPAASRLSPQQEAVAREASLPQPSSQLATAITHGATADSELESTASAPNDMLASEAAVAAAEEAASPEEAGGRPAPLEGAAGGEAAAEAEAAVPQPLLQQEPSLMDRVSVLPSPPFPAPPAEDGGGGDGSPPSDMEGMSGIPTPEEPASPPSTPVAGAPATIQVPVPVSLPMETPSSSAPEPNHVPQPHMAAAPPPRLLTPSDMAQQPLSPTHIPHPPERASPPSATSAAQPQPSLRILQRPPAPAPAPAPVATGPLAPLAAAPAAGPAGEAGEQPSAAAAAAAAAAGVDAAALGEAVAEQLGGAHKKFVGHVSLMYRELLKAMRAEMAAHAKQTEQTLSQLVSQALQASAQQVQQERTAVLAEERANFERLLVAVSTTLNQDLPNKLQESVRTELAALTGSMAAAVAPAVQQAMQAALPKEVTGVVKSQLEKTLTSALQAQLAKPLQEAFRTSFQKSLLPAFEGACQSMFAQINGALAQGFQEHVQAAKAAVEEPGRLAAQLRESLATAAALAGELRSEQALLGQQLSRTASLAAAPHDARAELARDLQAGRYEEAFSAALGLQDLATVSWLCSKAEPGKVLSQEPCPLSQMVLLSLVQQLAAGLESSSPPAGGGSAAAGKALGTQLAWIREAAMLINPRDPVLSQHFRPVLEQVYAALQRCAARAHGADASACKLAMHVVHSQLVS